jgi:hypothetical protein
MFERMRSLIFDTLGVRGLVVDVPASGGAVALVALADGTASMYTSAGGGIVGAGLEPQVAAAVRQLLDVAGAQQALFVDPDDRALPPEESVRFHWLTAHDARRLDVPADAFWGRVPHALAPTIGATQQFIAALQAADAAKPWRQPPSS